MSKLKIALLSGGTSNEREVSLRSGEAVFKALDKNKYEIFRYDLKTDLENFLQDALQKKFSLVLPILHGEIGEDGRLQGLLDILQIKYVFSNHLAHAISMNKNIAKTLVAASGITTPPSISLNKLDNYDLKKIQTKIDFPIMVKPVSAGSSVGINKANNEAELTRAISIAFQFDNQILLEKYIKGREFTVAVIGNKCSQALPIIEIIPKAGEFYDYRSKYEDGGSEHLCPAELETSISESIKNTAVKIFQIIGCADLARVDFILDENNIFYFIEINTIPGMTSVSLAPEAARASGLEFPDFLDRLIENALEK